MAVVVHTEGLCKRYGTRVVVHNLNLHVEAGTVYGFLGPNGAGKTTTLMMLLGLERPTRGRIALFGQELADTYFALKRRIGVVSENPRPYPDLSGAEYLAFFARLHGVGDVRNRVDRVLRDVGLHERRHDPIRQYSRGMQQKLDLARALVHEPDLLILDEPVSGLDPHAMREVRDIIRRQRASGKTILISSHILSEIEKTADRIGIINRGELLAEDDIATVVKRLQRSVDIEIELDEHKPQVERALAELDFVLGLEPIGERLLVRTKIGTDHRREIAQAVSSAGGLLLSLVVRNIGLEEAFVQITDSNAATVAGEVEKRV